MTWETREYRALAVGYAAALIFSIAFGVTWLLPISAIAASVICYAAWR